MTPRHDFSAFAPDVIMHKRCCTILASLQFLKKGDRYVFHAFDGIAGSSKCVL